MTRQKTEKQSKAVSLQDGSICDVVDHEKVIIRAKPLTDCERFLRLEGFIRSWYTRHLWARRREGCSPSDYRRVVLHDPRRNISGVVVG